MTVGLEGKRTWSGSSGYLRDISDPVDGVLRATDLGGHAAPVEVHLQGGVLGAVGGCHLHGGGQADLHWEGRQGAGGRRWARVTQASL